MTVKQHTLPILLAVAYFVVGVLYSVVNPIHEATDEIRHYRYVRYIADLGQLPVQSEAAGNAQAHHPPLYYASAALASFWVRTSDPLYEPVGNPHWSFRNWEVGTDNKNLYVHGPDEAFPYRDAALASRLARWTTLLWGAGAVALTILSAQTLLPNQRDIAIMAGLLIAFCPMFLYLGAAANNDVPAGLMGAAITLVSLWLVRDGFSTRRLIMLGVLYGLALLTKFNLLAMGGVIALALLLAPTTAGQSRINEILKAGTIIAVITLLIAGWWYVRNTLLYGEPTGFLRLTEIWGFRDPDEGVQLAWRELGYAWTSLWARFGYGQIPLPQPFYLTVGIVAVLGIVGAAAYLLVKRGDVSVAQYKMIALLAASVLLNFIVLYAYITVSPAGAMGRFFFPGMSAFVLLVAFGVGVWLPRALRLPSTAVMGVAMLAFALIALFGYIQPAYAVPQSVVVEPSKPIATLGENVRILDYTVSTEQARPGEQVDVTVTWQVIAPTAEPHAIFIHLINEQGVLVAQRDTYAGLGTYPSHWWQPGHTFRETYRIFLPDTAYLPDDLDVRIGLYNVNDFTRLPIEQPNAVADALTLGQLSLLENPDAPYPNATYVNYNGYFALVGYEISPRVIEPDDEVEVTLYWEAINPPDDVTYKVFIQLIAGLDARWASNDGPPVNPATQTIDWQPGETLKDVRVLNTDDDIPLGLYDIHVGWFNDDGERLRILAEDGRILENHLVLGRVAVAEDVAETD